RGTWRPVPADKGHRGRGLDLIRALGQEVEIRPGAAGTEIEFLVVPIVETAVPTPRPGPGPLVPDLHVVREADGLRVEVRGELDLASAGALRTQLIDLVGTVEPGALIRLDLDGVGYLASAGVGMLVDLVRHAADRGIRISLGARPGTAAARVLDLAQLRSADS
ncbi:STAS domain-containing protein, partial [Pseudonocardia pini]|uniref:STAS domain-containing protein n=1 Tax=Pseudonocardia pini TaxID=2758030 RepID=UPI0015EFF945